MAGRNVTASSGPSSSCRRLTSTIARDRDHVIQRSEFSRVTPPDQPKSRRDACNTCSNSRPRVARCTGMDVANASMYDGSPPPASRLIGGTASTKAATRRLLSGGLHPYADVNRDPLAHVRRQGRLAARRSACGRGHQSPHPTTNLLRRGTGRPDVFGESAVDLTKIAEKAHAHGALLIGRLHRGDVARPDPRRRRTRWSAISSVERRPVDRKQPEFSAGPNVGLFARR